MNKKPTSPTSHVCQEHEWVVFSTSLDGPCLLVQCADCYATGGVFEPSYEEWCRTTDEPYRWHDNSRVKLLGSGSPPYVVTPDPRKATKRLSEDDLLDAFHSWLESGHPNSVEVDGQRHEAQHVCKVLRTCNLVLPAGYCRMLNIPDDSTYGDAVRRLLSSG